MFLNTETVTLMIGFVVLLGIYIYSTRERKGGNKTREKKPIPGPKLVDKKLGHIAEIQAAGNINKYQRKLHAIYGPVVGFYQGPTYTVSLGTAAAFNQSRKLFDRPPFIYEWFAPFFGSRSLEVCNGEEARIRHAAYTRFLNFRAISPYYPMIQKKVSEICSLWSSESGAVDVCYEIRKYALVAVEIILFRGFVPDDKEILEFIDKFEEAWAEMERYLKGDVMEPGSEREKHMNQCIKETNTRVLNVYKTSLQSNPDDETTFNHLATGLNLDEQTISDDVFSFVAAGYHTTAFVVEWGFYFLAKYPHIQEKMYHETQEVLGDEPISADAFKYLVYMRQFIDELQRWVSIAPFAARINYEDIEIEGYTIPANMTILQALETVHFDKANYSDPESFDPDRYTSEKRKSQARHSLEPFGFSGGRRCVGSQVFNTEATIMFTTVVQKLQLSLPPNAEEIYKEIGTFSRPTRNVRVLFKDR